MERIGSKATEQEARELLRARMGNDYFFLPQSTEAEWVRQIMNGEFFVDDEGGLRTKLSSNSIEVLT